MKVLFVCLGNICRSPSAEGVFRKVLEEQGLLGRVDVDSCGIGDWHIGKAPDLRAQQAAQRRGIDVSRLRARQLCEKDFSESDLIIAMDHDNLTAIRAMQPQGYQGTTCLFLSFAGQPQDAVPDPYYGGEQGFENVLDMIEAASNGLAQHLRPLI